MTNLMEAPVSLQRETLHSEWDTLSQDAEPGTATRAKDEEAEKLRQAEELRQRNESLVAEWIRRPYKDYTGAAIDPSDRALGSPVELYSGMMSQPAPEQNDDEIIGQTEDWVDDQFKR